MEGIMFHKILLVGWTNFERAWGPTGSGSVLCALPGVFRGPLGPKPDLVGTAVIPPALLVLNYVLIILLHLSPVYFKTFCRNSSPQIYSNLSPSLLVKFSKMVPLSKVVEVIPPFLSWTFQGQVLSGDVMDYILFEPKILCIFSSFQLVASARKLVVRQFLINW